MRRLAAEFQQTYPHLHLLVNNAGGAYPTRTLTSEGFEATLALNYLAPFLLTELLLDTLKASAPARIVNVSSATHTTATIEFDNLQGEKKHTLALGNFARFLWGHAFSPYFCKTVYAMICSNRSVKNKLFNTFESDILVCRRRK